MKRSNTTPQDGVVELSGPLTIREASGLHQHFLQLVAARTDTTLGLGAVSDLDGAGLQLLLALARALEDGGCALVLRGATGTVRQALQESGVGRLLHHETGGAA